MVKLMHTKETDQSRTEYSICFVILVTGGPVVIVCWNKFLDGFKREFARLEAVGKWQWIKKAMEPNLYVGGEGVIYNFLIC